jgi:hypothetical protein
MQEALWLMCPEVLRVGEKEHLDRDTCEVCTPFWEAYPICPHCDTRLTEKGYCRKCEEEFDLDYPRILKYPYGGFHDYRLHEGLDYGRIDDSAQ